MTQGFPEMCGFCFLLYISSLEMGFGGQLEGEFTQCQAWREVLTSGRGKHSESCVYEPSVKFSSRAKSSLLSASTGQLFCLTVMLLPSRVLEAPPLVHSMAQLP